MLEKYFDEKSLAESMIYNQCFNKCYSVSELMIYGKYLKYKKLTDYDKSGEYNFDIDPNVNKQMNDEVEAALIDFATKHYVAFNYNVNYKDIDMAMDGINKYMLKLPLALPITETEYNTLLNIDNDVYRKILFCMLVDAKYYYYYNTSIENRNNLLEKKDRYYIQMSDQEIFKACKITFDSKEDKEMIWNRMLKDIPEGLCGISSGKYNNRYICFVDVDPDNNINPVDYITDYNRIDLHYRKLFNGENYSACKYCGALFKQSKRGNDALFCSKHRKYIKNECFRVCDTCGSIFYSKSNNKKICTKCKRHMYYIKASGGTS